MDSSNTPRDGMLLNHRIAYIVSRTTPTSFKYQALNNELTRLRRVQEQGGWKKIPKGKKLRLGSISKIRVPLMAERLYITEDLNFFDPDITIVTEEMKEALKHYQKRMGIWPSGVLTATTRNALNVSVEKRLKKIKLNLERMRWENREFGNEYIYINIPDFKMQFMKDGMQALAMRVVVGRTSNPTPIFDSVLSYMVLNPTWAVPNSIVKKEMLPRIQEDPDYLVTRKFKLYRGWKDDKEGAYKNHTKDHPLSFAAIALRQHPAEWLCPGRHHDDYGQRLHQKRDGRLKRHLHPRCFRRFFGREQKPVARRTLPAPLAGPF